MKYNLTTKFQFSYHDKDGKDRNYILFYLNNILILKQKIPFDDNLEKGYDGKIHICDPYLLNGRLYQTRVRNDKVRNVSYPISKKRLEQFNIPKDLKIEQITIPKS